MLTLQQGAFFRVPKRSHCNRGCSHLNADTATGGVLSRGAAAGFLSRGAAAGFLSRGAAAAPRPMNEFSLGSV